MSMIRYLLAVLVVTSRSCDLYNMQADYLTSLDSSFLLPHGEERGHPGDVRNPGDARPAVGGAGPHRVDIDRGETGMAVTVRRPTSPQLMWGGAGGARTHDRQIMSP